MQVRNWEYVGWSDTKFIQPKEFGGAIDLPRFYETMTWISDGGLISDNPEDGHQQLSALNTDSVTAGELLIGFF